ncbi:NAD(P)-binding protein [Cryphonectria parasitica EP155]|uniref:NAD(P)-binding protein n=1 Tax=Cryphonectria parasitica (strain ATCC 38755 / EP155) TaxID=660469 RepID=A0A9P5CK70_CRYP1|nr:NAD(P)-binding protein [Cryphonectria parasitica EP155]KAF3760656.1 NAD(P)-binding protein [Cryphonectria parasitica EP155]
MASRILAGKLGIVTGASRGIGSAIAENLASKGCNLVLNYTSKSSTSLTKELSKKLEGKYGIQTFGVQADLGTPQGPSALIAATKDQFLSSPPSPDAKFQIDVIVNNAGVARNGKLGGIKAEDFDFTYHVNVLGPLLLMQAAAPYLPTDRSGRVVNLSSISSDCGFLGQSIYGGSKAAIEAMTRVWARELSERATVNAVNPGPVEGPMYAANSDEFKAGIKGWIEHAPLMRARQGVDADEVVEEARTSGGRPAYVHEIAGIVGMLCTPDAAWCTGQVVCANGGLLMH